MVERSSISESSGSKPIPRNPVDCGAGRVSLEDRLTLICELETTLNEVFRPYGKRDKQSIGRLAGIIIEFGICRDDENRPASQFDLLFQELLKAVIVTMEPADREQLAEQLLGSPAVADSIFEFLRLSKIDTADRCAHD